MLLAQSDGTRLFYYEYEDGILSLLTKHTRTAISLVPEYRFYFFRAKACAQKCQGLFFQAGISLVSFGRRTGEQFWENRSISYQYYSKTSWTYTAYPGVEVWDYFRVPIGIGLKTIFTKNRGIEMNLSSDFLALTNQEEWQTVRVGLKYFWMIEKKKSAKARNVMKE